MLFSSSPRSRVTSNHHHRGGGPGRVCKKKQTNKNFLHEQRSLDGRGVRSQRRRLCSLKVFQTQDTPSGQGRCWSGCRNHHARKEPRKVPTERLLLRGWGRLRAGGRRGCSKELSERHLSPLRSSCCHRGNSRRGASHRWRNHHGRRRHWCRSRLLPWRSRLCSRLCGRRSRHTCKESQDRRRDALRLEGERGQDNQGHLLPGGPARGLQWQQARPEQALLPVLEAAVAAPQPPPAAALKWAAALQWAAALPSPLTLHVPLPAATAAWTVLPVQAAARLHLRRAAGQEPCQTQHHAPCCCLICCWARLSHCPLPRPDGRKTHTVII